MCGCHLFNLFSVNFTNNRCIDQRKVRWICWLLTENCSHTHTHTFHNGFDYISMQIYCPITDYVSLECSMYAVRGYASHMLSLSFITLYRTMNQRRPRSSLTEPLFVRKALKMRRGGSSVVSLVKPNDWCALHSRKAKRLWMHDNFTNRFVCILWCLLCYVCARVRVRDATPIIGAHDSPPSLGSGFGFFFFLLKNQIYDMAAYEC